MSLVPVLIDQETESDDQAILLAESHQDNEQGSDSDDTEHMPLIMYWPGKSNSTFNSDQFIRLAEDVMAMKDLFRMMHELVEIQQEPLESIELNLMGTSINVEKAEQELSEAKEVQSQTFQMKTILLVCLGTAAGLGCGSVGLFLGIKPAMIVTTTVTTFLVGTFGLTSYLW